MQLLSKTHHNPININLSLLRLAKAHIYQKLGFESNERKKIKIIKEGKEGRLPFVILNSDKIFFHNFSKNIKTEILSRYVYSHYILDQHAHPHYQIHRQHVDNLLTLKLDKEIKGKLLRKFPVKKGDYVLELGAFCGFGTMKLSEIVGDAGKVIAIEADATNYKILKKNITANNITNVITVNRGIWSSNGMTPLFSKGEQGNSLVDGLLKNPNISQEIKTQTIDDLLPELGIQKIDFVSMEINGAEVEALKGMSKTLSQNVLRLVSAGWYHYQGKAECIRIKKILEKFGFMVYIGPQNRVYAVND